MHAASTLSTPTIPTRAVADRRWAIGLGGLLPIAVFAMQGHVGFGKADEGFLWYGVQRVLAGEVPQRDFQSYDIGRYYWSAAWMRLLDDHGLVALRWSDALLASVTVMLATALACRGDRDRRATLAWLAAATFAVWMVPEYKAADSFATIVLIAGLARLIREAGPRGAATFGACLGLAATIGINHALYGTVGGVLAFAWLRWQRIRIDRPTMLALCAGTALGYAPVLFCHAFVPGFSAAFVDTIRMLFEAGTTNVEIPVPSPATVFTADDRPFVGALRDSLFASLFYGAPLFVAWCGWRLAPRPAAASIDDRHATFAAAVFLAVPYAHYVVSSAGTMHLAISGLPFLVAAWTFPVLRHGDLHRVACVVLLPLSLFLLLHAYAGYPWLRGRPLEPVVVHGDTLALPPSAAAEVRLVTRLTEAHPGRRFFAAHDWPGAYAIVDQRAPNWEIFEIFPALPSRQAREIARIDAARPAFVILTDGRPGAQVDGLEKTHPDVLRYLRRCFVQRETIRDPRLTVDVLEPGDRPCDAR